MKSAGDEVDDVMNKFEYLCDGPGGANIMCAGFPDEDISKIFVRVSIDFGKRPTYAAILVWSFLMNYHMELLAENRNRLD